MIYMSFLALIGLIIGFVSMASSPSPYYAALGLVLGAVCGCWILVDIGISFLSLVLLLIYLGGMLVVFAYSASLAAELYPEAWGNWSVLVYIVMYFLGMTVSYILVCSVWDFESLFSGGDVGFGVVINDYSGVGLMYTLGMMFLVISGWALLLTLFVVLEITRGVSRGSLRAV
uniref:NADH-ubiquinone oxidoreductase chain 6 n=1 Tax=Phaeognathus hubrichti TaxID=52110 RepID=Q644C8_PHAHU|nr:NADH dehydrogenase subunit 6 [Phaeognathus hubrichti]AAU20706.1 NADH dehydrogenase subunit 6 [Phaeognathus hubrichti]